MNEIYDQIYSVIETLFDTKRELLNPYETEDNNSLRLKQGYSLEIGPSADTGNMPSGIDFSRAIGITLTKINIASDKSSGDRKTKEKELLAEQLSLIAALKSGLTLVNTVSFLGDDGIEYVFNEREDYLKLRSNFNINYFKEEIQSCH